MKLFIIVLSLILFYGPYIFGQESDTLTSVNVLEDLKEKFPDCKLEDLLFSDDDYQQLNDDLKKYCTTADSTKNYAIICRMLSYELKKACQLPAKDRPTKSFYKNINASEDICKKTYTPMTNQWIWNKITNNGQKDIGVKANALCTTVSTDKKTFRLARFFYKIAPRIRKSDPSNQQTKG